ncbi:transcriptional regulator [Aphanizomenon phage vB_AphaS-CL131]|nr:transcriptional regulator [Aphanizomenon phage vB_AphaS-CL131]
MGVKYVGAIVENDKFWTKTGLEKLGAIIQQSRENRGLSLRQAAEFIKGKLDSSYVQTVDHGTISRIEKGHGEPKWNTLVAIAASKLITCDRGIPLTIYDFIDIASENRVTDMDILIKLIKVELQNRGWTLRRMAEETGIELADLLDISEGKQSEDFEGDLTLLALVLTNPKTRRTFTTAQDIDQFCGIKIDPTHADCEQDHSVGLT